jgi:hypothetical protein
MLLNKISYAKNTPLEDKDIWSSKRSLNQNQIISSPKQTSDSSPWNLESLDAFSEPMSNQISN